MPQNKEIQHEYVWIIKHAEGVRVNLYLVSILESLPNTIGRGPAQVGATAAMAFGFNKPFFVARTAMVAACPPPKTTYSLSELRNNNQKKLIYTDEEEMKKRWLFVDNYTYSGI